MHPALTPFLAVRDFATQLQDAPSDFDEFMAMAEGKRFVLLGEATHGTQDFYRVRADITRRMNRFVQAEGHDDAQSALGDFQRFPMWMWRNCEIWIFTACTGAPTQ